MMSVMTLDIKMMMMTLSTDDVYDDVDDDDDAADDGDGDVDDDDSYWCTCTHALTRRPRGCSWVQHKRVTLGTRVG